MRYPRARSRVSTSLLFGATGVLASIATADVPADTRIHPATWECLDRADDGLVKAWVLFDRADKGLASSAAYEAAVGTLASTYHRRSIQRRRLRRTLPGLFDIHDLPVSWGYLEQIRATGARLRVVSRWLNGVSVLADRGQLERIDRLPFVKIVQPVRRGRKPIPVVGPVGPIGEPPRGDGAAQGLGAPAGGRDWYGESEGQLTQINLINLHDSGLTGDGVVVGVLDTGFQRSHVAFNEPGHNIEVVAEWDFISDDPNTAFEDGDPLSQHSHGTKVLGVIGAYKPGELVGGAYDASFILCKTEDTTDEYEAEEDYYVAGLEFVEANGGDMVTSSLCYDDWYTQSDFDGMTAVTTIAVNIATGNGVHCCNAVGNEGHDSDPQTSHLMAPADAFEVIACGAVDSLDEIAWFSGDGPTADGRVKPEVLARGLNTRTVSSSSDSEYVGASGTSFATPLVTCAVACLIEAHPEWTVGRMRTYLMQTASDYAANGTYDPTYVRGYGIVNAAQAAEGDCNENGVDDATDITEGTSDDCNHNTVPDECDIALGQSPDTNDDGTPDECQRAPIPTVSQWGMTVMVLLALTAGTILFRNGGTRYA